jgi:hypothetical protein
MVQMVHRNVAVYITDDLRWAAGERSLTAGQSDGADLESL